MKTIKTSVLGLVLAGFAALLLHGQVVETEPAVSRIIVQAADAGAAARAVEAVGGTVTHELGIIDAVGAELTAGELAALRRRPEVRQVYDDRRVEVDGKPSSGPSTSDTVYPTLVGADLLHALGVLGTTVTVAVVDTGWWSDHKPLADGVNGVARVLAQYDAIANRSNRAIDGSGHGTHVTSVVASSKYSAAKYNGVAPNVRMVQVKAFGTDGGGTYFDVIRGINWVVQNRALYNIRVLNCSFSAPPQSHYWKDPLNQAVMKAWQAGIVVVASAGNRGPNPMTVGVPGNVPYVITVGAMTDNYTTTNPNDDYLASWSSVGPTYEGFVKPEVVAPGGHMLGVMDSRYHLIAQQYPEFATANDKLFVMSGTSQAAAVVSGVVALLLEAQPALTPDQVKCRLMASAKPAVDLTNQLAYSVFQQGAGLVNASRAVLSTASGCANRGLDVAKDLATVNAVHYGGYANRDANGIYYVENPNSLKWNGGYSRSGAYMWSDAYIWSNGYTWSDAYMWSGAYLWSNAYPWVDAYLWSNGLTEAMSINAWVPQE